MTFREGKKMKRDAVKKGIDHAPHRSLFKVTGYTANEMRDSKFAIPQFQNSESIKKRGDDH